MAFTKLMTTQYDSENEMISTILFDKIINSNIKLNLIVIISSLRAWHVVATLDGNIFQKFDTKLFNS